MSDWRNARSNYVYVGLDHNFRPDLTGSFRVGGRYTEYSNNPAGQSDMSPYAMADLRYTYLPESYFELGFSYDYSSTFQFAATAAGEPHAQCAGCHGVCDTAIIG